MLSLQQRVLFWEVVLVLTPLSGLASLLIILFVLWNLRKDFASRLIMYLSIADFGLSIICMALCGYNLHHYSIIPDSFACLIQPFITWYFMEASILWLSTIAVVSLRMVKWNKELSLIEEIIANLICWGIPFITSILPVISGTGEAYGGREDLWCTFSEDQKESQLLNILLYYGINLIIISTSYIAIIVIVMRTGKGRLDDVHTQHKLKVIKKLFSFVFCYFIVWTPLTIAYIWEYATGRYVSFGVELVVDNLLHVQGLLNGAIYGLFIVKKYWQKATNKGSAVTDRTSLALA